MRLVLSSVLLGLAWFGALNVVLSLASWAIGRALLARGNAGAPALLAIRLLPAIASLFFAVAIFLPAHFRYEEPHTEESFGMLLTAVAAFGAAILIRSMWRAASAGWRGRQALRATRRTATDLREGALAVRSVSGICLAGVLRPRVLVGSDALGALTDAELDVAISHEIAHQRSRDNVKRFLLFCAPDLLGALPIARRLEGAWAAEAEYHADAHAVRGDEDRAVSLASALVKVARLGGSAVLPERAWSAFHVPTLLEQRVRRLVGARAPAPASRTRSLRPVIVAGAAAPVLIWLADVSYTLHLVTEAMVTRLP